MKFSKLFGLVLCLHIGVIAIFILQPGCQTTQAPTRIDPAAEFGSERAGAATAARPDGERAPTTSRSTPRRPQATTPEPSDERADVEDSGWDSDFGVAFNPEVDRSIDDEAGPSIPVAGRSESVHVVERGDSLWAISRRYDVSMNELLEMNNLRRDSVLRVGQEIRVPREGGTVFPTMPSADRDQPRPMEAETTQYTVQSGDSLSRIASRHGTTVAAIRATNGLSGDLIRVGQVLEIPGSGQAAAPRAETAPRTPAPSAPQAARANERIHVVQAGEFPSSIAQRYGMTANELLALNNITDPRRLQVGQELRVRGSAQPQEATETQRTAQAPATRTTAEAATPQPSRPTTPAPVQIRAVEADPLPEGEADEDIFDEDELFRDAVEIPVIPVRRD